MNNDFFSRKKKENAVWAPLGWVDETGRGDGGGREGGEQKQRVLNGHVTILRWNDLSKTKVEFYYFLCISERRVWCLYLVKNGFNILSLDGLRYNEHRLW